MIYASFSYLESTNRDKSLSYVILFSVKAMEEKYCQRKIQQQFGIEFCNEENSFVIFEAQLINSSSVVRF